MGIQGLLQILKPIKTNISVDKYAWFTVGVDGHCWLHKGAHACAVELALNEPTTKYIEFFMHRVRMLKFYKVTPFIVFDGGHLPAKARTEAERRAQREEHRRKGFACFEKGLKDKARDHFAKAIEVTPEMVFKVIQALRAENVQYLVAPYEADAQLAYLERKGYISAVITEDSDLLVFGCKNVIFKMDQYGNGEEISRDNFAASFEYSMAQLSNRHFRQMAILSGCDYLPSIHGIGIKTAYQYIKKYHTAEKAIKNLRLVSKYYVPLDYEENFARAEMTFLHQRVFDMETGQLVTFTPVPENMDIKNMDFIGLEIDPNIARKIVKGYLNPITMQPLSMENPKRAILAPKTLNSQDIRFHFMKNVESSKSSMPINKEITSRLFAGKENNTEIKSKYFSQDTLKEIEVKTSFKEIDISKSIITRKSSSQKTSEIESIKTRELTNGIPESSKLSERDLNSVSNAQNSRVISLIQPIIKEKETVILPKEICDTNKSNDDKENQSPLHTRCTLRKRSFSKVDYDDRIHKIAQGWRKKFARTELQPLEEFKDM
ncbi:623_t:CDS:10 [Ambispora leptoticha]|uniref:623_t:CDS:1 n=1 Tax=Ambispora leptoticha TaxID=144679 RepID=A0A9N9B1I1_9GLOM|nr:623_t:CDS:10 [Ambispora leptoticha]